MRKANEIKASVIFLAWLVIFGHNIIPHNHALENTEGCSGLIHKISSEDHDCNIPSDFKNLHDEANVCHFSYFLFNHYNQDNVFISTISEAYFYPCIVTISVSSYNRDPYLGRPYYGSSTLRAPPYV